METVIVASGGANLASLCFALERAGARPRVTANARAIASAARVVLPGVGSAPVAMERLRASELLTVLQSLTQPVLGICLGMQLLFRGSSEGPTACLGILPDEVTELPRRPGLPVPHMGWNQLAPLRDDPLLEGLTSGDYAYFVHSYAAAPCDSTLATTDYGGLLSAVVRRRNFWGTQFHPERSAAVGARLLANFMRVNACD
jgi:imidazole glycerol-phosphate synthase subunit HisH